MENNFFKRFLSFALVMFTGLMSFAQEFPVNPEGGVGEDETPPADIDSKLVLLLVVAVAFGTYTLLKKYKAVKN